jgi:hypothetical protein
MWSVPREVIRKLGRPSQFSPVLTLVEVGSNTSTVTLRVAGGDEKGSLKSETVKCGLGTKGPLTQEGLHWQGPVVCTKDRPVLSSERALHKNRTVIVKD